MGIQELFDVSGLGVVVTGGASGLGLAYAEALAEGGGRVTILDLAEDRVDREVARLTEAGLDVRGAQVDVTDHARLDELVDEAADVYGRLDVMFANAGVDPGPGFAAAWDGRGRNPEGALENYTTERWSRALDVNLTGLFASARAAARHMKPRKSGRIVFTTSVAGRKNESVIGASYMAAKAGAAHLMRNIALELGPYNIAVNAIAPGWFVTNIGGGHAQNPDAQATMAGVIPMHRVGWPDDIKGLAVFLSSPASAYITGVEITIDGGWRLGRSDLDTSDSGAS